MTDALDYYSILNIRSDASLDLIKSSYKDLAKKWHPDHNDSPNALEVFQSISVAYDVLKDDYKRCVYDMLCLVYTKSNFPDMFNLKPYQSKTNPTEINLRSIPVVEVLGMLYKEKIEENKCICTYKQAVLMELRSSIKNWILGWWSVKAFAKNFDALLQNYKNVDAKKDNLKLLVHNAIAYAQEGENINAYNSILLAKQYASKDEKILFDKFVYQLDSTKAIAQQKWNFTNLKLVQLAFPLLLLLVVFFPTGAKYVTDIDLLKLFEKNNQISYYQEVRFSNSSHTVDDVIVAKVLNISVDTNDMSKLYHANKKLSVMVGPDDNFDVLKVIQAQTTVRLTGYTPDNRWFRIMLDNGDMGFVHTQDISKGIGKEIPSDSKIYTGIR